MAAEQGRGAAARADEGSPALKMKCERGGLNRLNPRRRLK